MPAKFIPKQLYGVTLPCLLPHRRPSSHHRVYIPSRCSTTPRMLQMYIIPSPIPFLPRLLASRGTPPHRILETQRMAMALTCRLSQQLSPSNRLLQHNPMICGTGTICLGSSALVRPSIRHTPTLDKTRLGPPPRHHIIPRHRPRITRAMVPDVVQITTRRTRIITCTRMHPGTDCRRRRCLFPRPHTDHITVHLETPNTQTQYLML